MITGGFILAYGPKSFVTFGNSPFFRDFVNFISLMKRANTLFLTRERRVNEKIRLRNRFTVVLHVKRAGLDFSSRHSGT